MKFLVDAQLPPALAHWLGDAGHEAQAVREAGLREAEDGDIWDYALAIGAAIITKDEDFPQRAQQANSSPVIVWLRIGNVSNRALRQWFVPLLPAIIQEIERGERLIEVR